MTRTLLGFETLCAMARNARRARIHNAADSHAAYAAHYHETGTIANAVLRPDGKLQYRGPALARLVSHSDRDRCSSAAADMRHSLPSVADTCASLAATYHTVEHAY